MSKEPIAGPLNLRSCLEFSPSDTQGESFVEASFGDLSADGLQISLAQDALDNLLGHKVVPQGTEVEVAFMDFVVEALAQSIEVFREE